MSVISKVNDQPSAGLRASSDRRHLPKRLIDALAERKVPFEICLPDGSIQTIGSEPPEFRVTLRNADAVKAVASLNEVRVGEAYIQGDIEFDGDLLRLFELREMLADKAPFTFLWRFVEPLLFGQIRTNRRAISSHYDVDADFFLSFLEPKVPSYTQGVYVDDAETLEAATIRKFQHCYDALQLKAGDHILDIGAGWGAWLEFASARGVKCTGLTISQASADYLRQRSAALGYDWNIEIADILEYRPGHQFDAITIMGVIEHLPHYDRLVEQFRALIKPGGRIFLDGSADVKKYDVANFLVRYIYPGNHSYMVLHDFLRHLASTPLRVLELYNDRHSYFLTAREWARNLDRNREFVVKKFGEDRFRAFRLYLWGTAYQFLSGGLDCYRMIMWHPPAKEHPSAATT
jgi:cyclopropane-fatty-acyl-phospholipid synthase